ncbi:MAG: DUF3592 domain-containing protein [Janthinobacterium lividum]
MLDVTAGIFTVFSVGIGGVFGYAAVAQHRKRTLLRQTGILTEGVVVRLEEDNDPESSVLYPVIRFTTLNGEVVIMRYNFGSQPSAYQLGQQVQLLYDPLAPREFVIGAGSTDWETLVFGLVGAGLLGVGLYGVIRPYI